MNREETKRAVDKAFDFMENYPQFYGAVEISVRRHTHTKTLGAVVDWVYNFSTEKGKDCEEEDMNTVLRTVSGCGDQRGWWAWDCR